MVLTISLPDPSQSSLTFQYLLPQSAGDRPGSSGGSRCLSLSPLSRQITAALPGLSGKSLSVSAELNQMLILCGERICWNLQGSSWQQENALIHSQICFAQAGCDLERKLY